MKEFNLELSYAIISAIRVGINSSIPEDEKITYDVDTAQEIYNQTKGYAVEDTIKYIESAVVLFNKPIIYSTKNRN